MQPHQNPDVERRFLFSIGITGVIFLAELIGGIWTSSLALLSDSAHVFMDIFALALSFVALRLSALPADDRHSFGYHRLEVLAALVNGVTLGLIALGIWREAFERFNQPQEIRTIEMLVIAVVGLLANLAVVRILGGHTHPEEEQHPSGDDLNLHSAYLHVLGDSISSVGVILAAVIISLTGWQWVDPLVSVLIGGLIAFSAYGITRRALHILIEGVPEGLSLKKVASALETTSGVRGVHELHIWNICSGHVALSAHVVMNDFQADYTDLRSGLQRKLTDQFGIEHVTLQFETEPCGLQLNGCGAPRAEN